MNSFGVTMAIAIAVSLLVSFTLTPMMSSRWLRREDLHHGTSTREHGIYGIIEATYLKMLDWSMAHRWVIVAGPWSSRSSRSFRSAWPSTRTSCRRTTSRSSRSRRARRKDPACRRRRRSWSRSPPRPQDPRSRLHDGHHRRRSAGHAEPRQRLRASQAGRKAQARSVRDHGRRPQEHPAAVSAAEPAHVRRAGQRIRRRRQRRDHVLDRRTRPEAARAHLERAAGEAQRDAEARRRRSRHELSSPASRSSASASIATKPRTSACACRTSPRR